MKRIFAFFAVTLLLGSVVHADPLKNFQAGFRLVDGSQLNKMVAVVNGLTANGTAVPITGTTGLFTTNSANALAVGPNGITNPTFNIDASTASAATGLNVKSAAAASGLALSVLSSGNNENLTIDAKGSGTISLGATSTGNIVVGRALTGVSSSYTGAGTFRSATATPAAASAVAALSFGSAAIGLYWGTGTPSIAAAKGSLYIQTDGSSASTRLFINSDGSTAWVAITTAS